MAASLPCFYCADITGMAEAPSSDSNAVIFPGLPLRFRPMASADRSRVLAVVHQETSRTGRVGQLLDCWGYEVERCCPNIGRALPDDLSPYAGVVMFGG